MFSRGACAGSAFAGNGNGECNKTDFKRLDVAVSLLIAAT